MLIEQREKSAENLGRLLPITRLDEKTISRAKDIFADYHHRGIIIRGDFDSPSWKLSNETSTANLIMLSFGEMNSKNSEWIGLSFPEYAECVKAYIALKLGSLSLSTLRQLSKTLSSLPLMTVENAAALTHNSAHIAEFLSLLPGGTIERDLVEETLEERVQVYRKTSSAGSHRVLSAFNSYLQFHEIITEFWQTACDDEKLFYFPLYLWWNLTTILPLRPTEFLLTQRDCLDGNSLTVRRTKMKGGGKTAYRIAQDYELHTYEITSALAFDIRRYIELTEHMRDTQIDTLLRLEPHFSRVGGGIDSRNRYYTYHDMKTCLDRFFTEIIEPSDAKIKRIKLGDTRHLAMVNLIISGGSPTICRELAGHADIGISSHYYTNLSELVENVTIGRLRKAKGGGAEFVGKPYYPLKRPDNMLRLSEGWCDAEALKRDDVSECMKVVDGYGRIGECANCGHYWSDVPGIRAQFFDKETGKQRVDLDSAFLMRMIELVRKGLGYEEDVTSALLRLQHSCHHLSDCIMYLNAEAT